jgi:hypothetical protein
MALRSRRHAGSLRLKRALKASVLAGALWLALSAQSLAQVKPLEPGPKPDADQAEGTMTGLKNHVVEGQTETKNKDGTTTYHAKGVDYTEMPNGTIVVTSGGTANGTSTTYSPTRGRHRPHRSITVGQLQQYTIRCRSTLDRFLERQQNAVDIRHR